MAIINDVAMSIGVHVSVCTCLYFSWIYTPRSEIPGSYDNCLTFEKPPDCFPKQLHHPIRYEGSSSYTSLSTLAIACLIDFSYPSSGEVVCHCSFELHFSDD